jgi:hypothetical protein
VNKKQKRSGQKEKREKEYSTRDKREREKTFIYVFPVLLAFEIKKYIFIYLYEEKE